MSDLAHPGSAPISGPELDNRRILAGVIDLALLVPMGIVLIALFGNATGAASAVMAGWALFYYFALESDEGQTIGKRVMKLRVVRADGGPMDMGRIAIRTLLRPIDAVGAYLLGLIVMMATGKRRQRLGDLAAGTIVADAGGSAAPQAAAAVATPMPAMPAGAHLPEIAHPDPEPVEEPEAAEAEVAEPEIEAPEPEATVPIVHTPVDIGRPLPSADEPAADATPEQKPFVPEPTEEPQAAEEPAAESIVSVEPAAPAEPEPAEPVTVEEALDRVADEPMVETPEEPAAEAPEEPESAAAAAAAAVAEPEPKLENISSAIDLVMADMDEDERKQKPAQE